MAGPTDTEELSELHLAELHARAAAAGVEGYRLLRREALIERLGGSPAAAPSRGRRRRAPDVDLERDTDEVEAIAEAEKPAEPTDEGGEDASRPRRRRGRRGGRGRGEREKLAPEAGEGGAAGAGEERDDSDEAATEQVTGTLELTRQRHGFLRVPGSDDDVYVSASQVRRCELKADDEVTGPARAPRRSERHRALVRVELVNGAEPVDLPAGAAPGRAGRPTKSEAEPVAAGPDFDSFTAAPPSRRIALPDGADPLPRAVDLLAPLAFGQRVLVRSVPRSGRTALLRALASTLAVTEGVDLTVLLIDERPEEVPAWSEAVAAESLALAPADLSPGEQVKVATAALDRARAKAAEGADAVLLCDSLSRLAVAADGLGEVKRLFGSGRDLADDAAGSLTVIATALDEGDDDGSAERAVATTETSLVTLDPSLAEEGIVPALRFAECRAVGEENLLSEQERDGLRHLRTKLADLVPPEAAKFLRELLAEHATNAEALKSLA